MRVLTVLLFVLGCSIATFAQEEEMSSAKLYNSGLEKLKAKDYAAALPLMEKAIANADPESETDAKVVKLANRNGAIAAYYSAGDLRKAEKYDEAIALYEKGIAMNEGFYANHIGLAQALDGKGESVKAIKSYVKAGEIAEKSPKTADKAGKYYAKAENFAAIAYSKKQYAEAVEYAQAFLDVKESPDAYYYLSSGLRETGKPGEAVEPIDKAIEMAAGGDTDKFYVSKAETHEALGQKSAAIDAYKAVKGGKYLEVAKYKLNELEK